MNEIMSAAHQLTAIGFEINQEWLGIVLLAGLPDHYQPMIMALENSGMNITGDSVKTKLLQESKCSDKVKSSIGSDTAFHVKRHVKDKKQKSRYKKNKCWSCDKYGHFASECSDKRKDSKENKDSKK